MFRVLLVLALSLGLVACDSGSGEDGPTDASCATTGTQDLGTVTATTPSGSFRSSCAAATSSTGDLVVIVRTPGNESALGGESLEFVLQDLRVGTYTLGEDDDDFSTASYGRTPLAMSEAASGTVVVTSLSGGIEATFSFTTVTGQEVTDGRLDLSF